MKPTFIQGQVVTINRPGREHHGAKARFLDPSQDADLVYVALDKKNPAIPPDERIYRKNDQAKHKLFPISQIQP